MLLYSVRPPTDSPNKVFNGLNYLFHHQILNPPTFYKSSRRDATNSNQCEEEFECSNIVNKNVLKQTKSIKESCFGSSMSPQLPVTVFKPIKIRKEINEEFAAEVSEWKKSIQAHIKLSEWDEEILEWSLIEMKKLTDEVLHSSARMGKLQKEILSSINSEVKNRQDKLLREQQKMETKLREIYDWQKKIVGRLALGEKIKPKQDCEGVEIGQAKMRKMEETMKKILVNQMKMEKVQETVLRAYLNCYGMEEQIREKLEEMEATQRRNILKYEEIVGSRINQKKGSSSRRRLKVIHGASSRMMAARALASPNKLLLNSSLCSLVGSSKTNERAAGAKAMKKILADQMKLCEIYEEREANYFNNDARAKVKQMEETMSKIVADQMKFGSMISELYEKREANNHLDKTTQAKMKEMEETMKKILAAQMKMGNLEETIVGKLQSHLEETIVGKLQSQSKAIQRVDNSAGDIGAMVLY
ncbi:hypothetical protein COLO4_03656 [Corchorus olitorius]|uniref:Uncharacterized protein n=1 Tax=Corchorus olitorius TaxID=93759 RepID=A0A1R3KXM9_9ROSI|nr:hypothetical protein COLO4_03656 [Corchorus olitorius]